MKIYTVTEFNQEMKNVLSEMTVTVQGEISGFRINQGRFVFFALKDKQSSVDCFLMHFQLKVKIADGMEIRVTGSPSLFVKSGRFNISVKEIELIGDGALQQQYEQLKRKLSAEGLFNDTRKRPLPRFPETIGLVTSEDAAAYTDIMRILGIRWPLAGVILHSVPVQGPTAVPPIVAALQAFSRRKNVEVVILARGGGSMEDLQAFNSEAVARAVFGCQIPVVSGVGHERDVTLVDFVADQRAATPTHAAELVAPHQEDVMNEINQYLKTQYKSLEDTLSQIRFDIHDRLQRLTHILRDQIQNVQELTHRFLLSATSWINQLNLHLERLKIQNQKLLEIITAFLDRMSQRINHQERLLASLHPLHILKRGYSVTHFKESGKIVRETRQARKGDIIVTRLQDGSIESQTL